MSGVIATLGPIGTDSHRQAERLSTKVSLHETFHEAICHAKLHKTKLLVPAGFRENRAGKQFSWVDFHFENLNDIELEKAWFEKTMPMVLLHNSFNSIAIHPSTSSLVPELERYEHVKYTRSKVEAYQLFTRGEASAALTSSSIIDDTSDKQFIKAEFRPTMVWCLYKIINSSLETQATFITRET
ncbi:MULTISPECIES: hypothetical protein [Pseudomonas]|uniref:hypothetical protein n=1 Tax=Pseudomonas TaxID=286 RepID=UPI000BA33DE7|nr:MULTISPECIES: hypothetical protein [Pseudomonas]MDR9862710.1 hypothetical protein [Pseudomonas baetica]